MNITKDRPSSRLLRISIQKAMTKSIMAALRTRMYREAYLDLISLAMDSETNIHRVSRLRNLLVTFIDHELTLCPFGHSQLRLSLAMVCKRAKALPVGWSAVEGGAA